ncbi:hypothetical protein JNM05_12275 [bacterium]|nr:hypothetical protein [bacterium]
MSERVSRMLADVAIFSKHGSGKQPPKQWIKYLWPNVIHRTTRNKTSL